MAQLQPGKNLYEEEEEVVVPVFEAADQLLVIDVTLKKEDRTHKK